MASSRVVWKFEPSPEPQDVPADADWLTAQWQASEFGYGIAAWALVSPDAPKRSVVLSAVATGQPVPEAFARPRQYIGTAQSPDGIVAHVFAQEAG